MENANLNDPRYSMASSSTASASSVARRNGSGRGSSRHSSTSGSTSSSHMESSVTRLLVATKQLLESLTKWSQGRITEQDVSDIYVRLGNEFNVACRAFSKEGISMTELLSVPDQLRTCLEACLSSEEVSPATLEIHLPQIREIIIGLLQGLKGKQQIYRSIVAERRARESKPIPPPDNNSVPGSPPSGSAVLNDANGRPVHNRSISRVSRASQASEPGSTGVPSRPTTPANANGSVRRGSSMTASEATATSAARRIGGSMDEHSAAAGYPGMGNNNNVPPLPSLADRPKSVAAVSSENRDPPFIPPDRPATSLPPAPAIPPLPPASPLFPETAPPPPPPPPPEIRMPERHDTPPLPPEPPSEAQMNSLAALQKSDVLARRASKRFSAYTFNKMTGAPGGKGDASYGIGSAMMNLTGGAGGSGKEGDAGRELVNGTKEERRRLKEEEKRRRARGARERKGTMPTLASEDVSEEKEDEVAAETEVPPVPSLASKGAEPVSTTITPPPLPQINTVTPTRRESSSSESEIKVFLQLGREVKKCKIDSSPTISSLRMLFMERFQYNPGMETFPSIYIRDTKVGVQYELEDMTEVQDGCVLSLNIEPLDQVKQHIDQGLLSLSQDIKDLKTSLTSLRRQSYSQNALAASVPPDHPISPVLRPTETQFHAIAHKVLKLKKESLISNRSPLPPEALPLTSETGSAPQTPPVVSPLPTSASVDGRVGQIVSDLKNNFDEVQNLRRDIGVIRQVYDTFTSETKQLFATLRTQNENVRRLANTKPAGARAFLEAGKTKLDSRTQELVTKIDELSDTVEDLKHDVTNRKIRPKTTQVANVRKLIESTKAELESISEYISSTKPSWKQTWAAELQNVVEEQQLLNFQEELLKDLQADHEDFCAVFSNIEQYLNLKGASSGRAFVPPPPKEGHQGLSTVMKEVQLVNSDPDRRMKALAQAEKAREQSLLSSQDEFANDLASFVSGKMLKKTGGTEEVERIRQKKSALALKAMFASNNAGSSPPTQSQPSMTEGTGES
ncbi:AIP3-domain-containing protein [Atractiella rhizophila]|nr:AIP3-domain-containing protein [Atractiella rhizophila]